MKQQQQQQQQPTIPRICCRQYLRQAGVYAVAAECSAGLRGGGRRQRPPRERVLGDQAARRPSLHVDVALEHFGSLAHADDVLLKAGQIDAICGNTGSSWAALGGDGLEDDAWRGRALEGLLFGGRHEHCFGRDDATPGWGPRKQILRGCHARWSSAWVMYVQAGWMTQTQGE